MAELEHVPQGVPPLQRPCPKGSFWALMPWSRYASFALTAVAFLVLSLILRSFGESPDLATFAIAVIIGLTPNIWVQVLSGIALAEYERAFFCTGCRQVWPAILICPQCLLPAHTVSSYSLETLRRACDHCRHAVWEPDEIQKRGLRPVCSNCHDFKRLLYPVLPVRRVGLLTDACLRHLLAAGEKAIHRECGTSLGPISQGAATLVLRDDMALWAVDLSEAARLPLQDISPKQRLIPLDALWISAEADPLAAGQTLDQIARLPPLEAYLARGPLWIEANGLPTALTTRLKQQLAVPRYGISRKTALAMLTSRQ